MIFNLFLLAQRTPCRSEVPKATMTRRDSRRTSGSSATPGLGRREGPEPLGLLYLLRSRTDRRASRPPTRAPSGSRGTCLKGKQVPAGHGAAEPYSIKQQSGISSWQSTPVRYSVCNLIPTVWSFLLFDFVASFVLEQGRSRPT